MIDINAGTFMAIFSRLSPFILVCFFTISSVFENDLKGIVYLIGLLFSLGITVFIGNTEIVGVVESLLDTHTINIGQDEKCKNLMLDTQYSKLPIGQAIIGFTFTYLLVSMMLIESITVSSNWPTVVFFILLIINELNYNTSIFDKNKDHAKICNTIGSSVITYVISFSLGGFWAWLISTTGSSDLQYFKEHKNNEKCGKVNHSKFKCEVYKNGEKI